MNGVILEIFIKATQGDALAAQHQINLFINGLKPDK
jgi:hypothetical protein